jgi:RNA polymerase sigma-70 factor, ECF subfamily
LRRKEGGHRNFEALGIIETACRGNQNSMSAYLCMGKTQSHFEELLLPHLDGAYNLARWLIKNDQDAQAIVQEAYLQARQELPKSREADARNWLLTIVRKKAGKWVEQHEESSKPILLTEAPREQHSSAIANKSLTLVTDEERRRLLDEAFNRLPVEFREVLLLHEIEGWSYKQLASALEIPQATVSHRLSMARQTLRQQLGEVHVGC